MFGPKTLGAAERLAQPFTSVNYADPNLGQLVASVYERVYPNKPTDNIFNSLATIYALGDKGFKAGVDGGRLIESTLEYAENTTMQMVSEYQTLDTTRIDVFDCARYDWKIAAGTVQYSYLEMLRVQGDLAKFDLIEGKIENGRNSLLALMNRNLWNTSTPGANDFISIPTIISATPTTGTVGGINAANFSFWRNRQASGALSATAFDNLQGAMRSVHNQCSLGGLKKRPTAIITDRTDFEGFESTMVTLQRYMKEDKINRADPGFMNDAFSYKGIPFFYDEDHPAARVDFLNNEVLKFVYLTGAWMKLDPAVDPANQLVNVHKLYTMGALTCSARRHLGCVTSIT